MYRQFSHPDNICRGIFLEDYTDKTTILALVWGAIIDLLNIRKTLNISVFRGVGHTINKPIKKKTVDTFKLTRIKKPNTRKTRITEDNSYGLIEIEIQNLEC